VVEQLRVVLGAYESTWLYHVISCYILGVVSWPKIRQPQPAAGGAHQRKDFRTKGDEVQGFQDKGAKRKKQKKGNKAKNKE